MKFRKRFLSILLSSALIMSNLSTIGISVYAEELEDTTEVVSDEELEDVAEEVKAELNIIPVKRVEEVLQKTGLTE